ncbi:MAG: ABC transporter permease subunit, partial [Caldimonas sp.]
MLSYILKRIALMLPTLLGVLTVAFIVIQFVPGGPVEQVMAQARIGGGGAYKARGDIDAKQIEALKKLYGFDKPAPVRYLEMLKNFASFDLGTSFMQNKPVWTLIKEKLPVSVSLGLWTFLISYLISLPLGIAKAVRAGTRFDAVSTFFVMFGFAIPGFVLGVFLIVLFCGGTFWELVPLRGLTSDNWRELSWGARIRDYFWHLTLPLTCLVIGSFAEVTMLTK